MARPTKNNPTGAQKSPKRTPETIHKLEEAFSLGSTVAEACFYADISQSLYHQWIVDEPELSERFKELRLKPVLLARRTVIRAMQEDVNTAKWYLERKCRDEFATRVESTGKDGGPIETFAELVMKAVDGTTRTK